MISHPPAFPATKFDYVLVALGYAAVIASFVAVWFEKKRDRMKDQPAKDLNIHQHLNRIEDSLWGARCDPARESVIAVRRHILELQAALFAAERLAECRGALRDNAQARIAEMEKGSERGK